MKAVVYQVKINSRWRDCVHGHMLENRVLSFLVRSRRHPIGLTGDLASPGMWRKKP